MTVVAPTALPSTIDALLRLALGGLLWVGTRRDEGWYLNGGLRAPVEPFPDHQAATSELESVALLMAEGSEGAMALPLSSEATCERPDCRWCALSTPEGVNALLEDRCEGRAVVPSIAPPFEALANIPHRVNVRGTLDGRWGPLPNHFGEPVLGAALTSGRAHVALEESQPGAAPVCTTSTRACARPGCLARCLAARHACTRTRAQPSTRTILMPKSRA